MKSAFPDTDPSRFPRAPRGLLPRAFALWALCAALGGALAAQERPARMDAPEYQLKATWLVNFLKFVDWPENQATLTIGVLGKDPFQDYLAEYAGKMIFGRPLIIKHYGRFDEHIDRFDCDLLFIAASERKRFKSALEAARGESVLTVSEIDGFLDQGGIINFLTIGNKLRYEINQRAALAEGLRISSQILGRAERVIKTKGDPPPLEGVQGPRP